MSDLFQEPDDATPLMPEERERLLQTWITHRRDLNEAEQENIIQGTAWARKTRRAGPEAPLEESFVRTMHKRMFGNVWGWAGAFRQTDRNIGIGWYRIPAELAAMLEDVRYWVRNETFPPDEIAIRFHHRLVAIHPFPNGNGRHARLMADLIIERLGGKPFSWGGGSLHNIGELRAAYVTALQAADNHDIGPLILFAGS